MKKILIVEDDIFLREELSKLLQRSGYETILIREFSNLLSDILKEKADLILLDINLPYQNGEQILKNIRKRSNVPVIMLTSYNNECDEVLSMSYGADDYITKPYHPTILLLHIEAIFRRIENGYSSLNYDNIVLIPERLLVNLEGRDFYLTKNEMLILKYLIVHRKVIVTREELMRYLWDSEEFVDDNTLSVNMSRLRAKLADMGLCDVIETRKGIGYYLK